MSDFKIDFCGVGAAKAGTTWVTKQLMDHPQTCIGRRKELNYFMRNHPLEGVFPRTGSHFDSLNYTRGMEWYEEQYCRCQPGQLKGELSTSYLADPTSPKLLAEHNPDLKLIMNIRNPVDAVYSVYYQVYQMHTVHETFEELLDRTNDHLEYYSYSRHMKRYLDYFPEEQIKFIFLDDIKADSNGVYDELCDFLGIDKVELDSVSKKVNPSTMVRSTKVRDLAIQIYYLFNKNETMRNIRDWMRDKKLSVIARKIRRWNSVQAKYPPMKLETRARLIEEFHDDIIEVGKMQNRDLSDWLKLPEEKGATAK
ncbi:sulfotransferase domain-containing protein [bacterium]|nr:sulfotransferase domain-containing protein [bacterium]